MLGEQRRTANARSLIAIRSVGALIAWKQDRERESMSEIVTMSQKIRTLTEQLTQAAAPGDRIFFEAMMTFAYTEGFKDGYAKGYAEAICETGMEENND